MFLSDCFLFLRRYFPASGYRYGSSAFAGIGLNGRMCLSSSYGTASLFGANVNLEHILIHPLTGGYRAEAFSVRCVQAFIE